MGDFAERLRDLLESARSSPGVLEYSLLGLGATVEYVFPPFPGDVVVLLGAYFVGRYDWSAGAVWVAVLLGSLVGMTADWAFGVWVRHRDPTWRQRYPRWARLGRSIDRFDAFYRRWGALCILLNRFIPAVRAVFFLAAGMAGIPYWKVLVLGLASAVAWNLLVFSVGVSVGHNWERLAGFLRDYTTVAWIAGVALAAVLIIVYRWRRRGGAREPTADPPR